MSTPRTAVSRADLLRALRLAQGDEASAQRYADALCFHFTPSTLQELTLSGIAMPDFGQSAISALPPDGPAPDTEQRASLRATLHTVTTIDYHADATPAAATPLAPLTAADCHPAPGARLPARIPLMRHARLWPALRASLSQARPAGIDLKRLVERLARAQALIALPLQQRRAWAGQLQVWQDGSEYLKPYHPDFAAVLADLQRLRGEADMQCWQVSSLHRHALPPQPASGSQVLILSDLGALADSSWRERQWRGVLHRLRQAGVAVSVWAPLAPRQVPADLATLAAIHCLHSHASLRRQRGHWHTPEQRQAEHQRLHALRERLLTLASCAVVLGPALLRALRQLDDALRAEPALEALCWNAQPLVGESHISRPLRPAHAPNYRQRLWQHPPHVQQAVLAAMLAQHACNGRFTPAAEALLWGAHCDSAAAGDAALQALIADAESLLLRLNAEALPDQGNAEAVSYARDLLARFSTDTHTLSRHPQLFADLYAISGLEHLPAGIDAAAVMRARQQRADNPPKRPWQLMQRGGDLWLWPQTEPRPAQASPIGGVQESAQVAITDAAQKKRVLRVSAQPQRLGRVGECQVSTPTRTLHLTAPERPAWADEWGRDRFGLYAEFRIKDVVQRMRWIEPGEFLMGSPDSEPGRHRDEGPQHRVRLSQGFWLADSACTQSLWLAVMGGKNPSRFQDDPECPVERVSWDEVQEFMQRLREHLPASSEPMLPCEAQWEYACRAGTTTPFNLGENITPEQVNYDGNYPYYGAKNGEYRQRTVPVKSLPPNAWGLYEMHGNVWEWCADGMRKYESLPAGEVLQDPLGPTESASALRALRGGSWFKRARFVRSAFRDAGTRGSRGGRIGFRLALRSTSPVRPEGA